jgi:hypothetical protein
MYSSCYSDLLLAVKRGAGEGRLYKLMYCGGWGVGGRRGGV